MSERSVLVTGAAGFIGYHVAVRLLQDGRRVVGLDNLNPYYDANLKKARLERLRAHANFEFRQIDIVDGEALRALFQERAFSRVIHLAAQAGVRYSLENPQVYIASNLTGFANVLECCRHSQSEHLVYASSSSVYGANTRMPFSIHHNVDHPMSLYAATKKADELMAHAYSHLFKLPTTGLRFFTVYGPWGRPDMAAFLFCKAILEGRPIELFNEGKMKRDFTYIDDIVEGVVRVMERIPQPDPAWNGDQPDPATSFAPYRVYNIGNHDSVELLRFVEILEKEIGRSAQKCLRPMQPGDVPASFADVSDLTRDTGFAPRTPIEEGLKRFVQWYKKYHRTI